MMPVVLTTRGAPSPDQETHRLPVRVRPLTLTRVRPLSLRVRRLR
jgi:hypothetical protein